MSRIKILWWWLQLTFLIWHKLLLFSPYGRPHRISISPTLWYNVVLHIITYYLFYSVYLHIQNIFSTRHLKFKVFLQIEFKLFIKLYFLLFNPTAFSLGKLPSHKPKPQTGYVHKTAHSAIYIVKKYTDYSETKLRSDDNERHSTRLSM